MMELENDFVIRRKDWLAMRDHLSSVLPEEGCGLLAGMDGCSIANFPIENMLHSSNRFRMNPDEQIQAFNAIENSGWEVLAIYHAHPNGPAQPSQTDLAEHFYPDTHLLIWTPGPDDWSCRAFDIRNGAANEINYAVAE